MNKLVYGVQKLGESLLNLENRFQEKILENTIKNVLKENESKS